MGGEQRPFGHHLFDSFVPLEIDNTDGFINSAYLPQYFQPGIHFHVRYYRQRQTILDVIILVFVQYRLGVVVQFNAQPFTCFLCYHIKEAILDVGAFEFGNIRISQPGEAAEQEHIPDARKA